MKKTTKMRLLILPLLFWLSGCGPSFKTADVSTTPEGFSMVRRENVIFEWKIQDDRMHIKLTAPTTGWVAVGFEPMYMMKNANLILGCVTDGEVKVSDEFGTGYVAHEPDTGLGGREDTADVEGWEKDGKTHISFTIPLDSGDEYDKKLQAGVEINILLAYGADGEDDFTKIHEWKTGAAVTL